MGITGLIKSNAIINIDNALIYLSTYTKEGSFVNDKKRKDLNMFDTHFLSYDDPGFDFIKFLNKYGTLSSGRLVLYSMENDPVSEIGFQYGEIYKVEPGLDAINNHKGKHKISNAIVNLIFNKNQDVTQDDIMNQVDELKIDESSVDNENILNFLGSEYSRIKNSTIESNTNENLSELNVPQIINKK